MEYIEPKDCRSQARWELREAGADFEILAPLKPSPWEVGRCPPKILAVGEMSITYYSHACIRIQAGGQSIFLDPWLTGPAFSRGWWLLHAPPETWLDDLSSSDAIIFSHGHSDHMNIPTLRCLAEKNKSVPLYVPDLKTAHDREFLSLGFSTLNTIQPSTWVNIGPDLRCMFLRDGHLEELDTSILVDYKGHFVLATVDCSCPHNFHLPENVDVLLTDFAAGASGFPVCMEGPPFTLEFKATIVQNNRRAEIQKVIQLVGITKPKFYIPYAGYFVIAHPDDVDIKHINLTNSAADVCEAVGKVHPTVLMWAPCPGGTIDVATMAIPQNIVDNLSIKQSWEFDSFIAELDLFSGEHVFADPNKAYRYYFAQWAGFRDYDLVLQIVETDAHFNNEFSIMIDFKDLSFPTGRPPNRNFECIRVRKSVMRKTVFLGKHWDDIFIGFNCRVSRFPNTYHLAFWEHFFSNLPEIPPAWDTFSR